MVNDDRGRRTVIWGKAVLELHPFGWRLGDGETDTSEQAAAVLRALWRADDNITSVSVAHDGTVLVNVVVPTDGGPRPERASATTAGTHCPALRMSVTTPSASL